MFSFPVTIPFHDATGVFPVDVTVAVDDVLKVTRLDFFDDDGVDSDSLYSILPSSEILMTDGRKLPVLETVDMIHQYLDTYRQIEAFYTRPAPPTKPSRKVNVGIERASGPDRSVVVPLFGNRSPCASSEASTPA